MTLQALPQSPSKTIFGALAKLHIFLLPLIGMALYADWQGAIKLATCLATIWCVGLFLFFKFPVIGSKVAKSATVAVFFCGPPLLMMWLISQADLILSLIGMLQLPVTKIGTLTGMGGVITILSAIAAIAYIAICWMFGVPLWLDVMKDAMRAQPTLDGPRKEHELTPEPRLLLMGVMSKWVIALSLLLLGCAATLAPAAAFNTVGPVLFWLAASSIVMHANFVILAARQYFPRLF